MTFKDFLRENSDSEIKNQVKEIIRIIDNSMDDQINHQEEMSYEGGEEEQDFIDGGRDIKDDLEDMLDADEEKMKSIAKRIRDTLDDMEEKDAGMSQNFKYNTYYNDAKAAENRFWRKITVLVDKLDSEDQEENKPLKTLDEIGSSREALISRVLKLLTIENTYF